MYLPFLLRKGSMVSTSFVFRVISRWSDVYPYSCRSSPGWLNRLPFALHLVRRFAFPLPQVPLSRGLSKDGAKVGYLFICSTFLKYLLPISSFFWRLAERPCNYLHYSTRMYPSSLVFLCIQRERLVLVVLFDKSFFPLLVFLRFCGIISNVDVFWSRKKDSK